jgi:hypothetical protein
MNDQIPESTKSPAPRRLTWLLIGVIIGALLQKWIEP